MAYQADSHLTKTGKETFKLIDKLFPPNSGKDAGASDQSDGRGGREKQQAPPPPPVDCFEVARVNGGCVFVTFPEKKAVLAKRGTAGTRPKVVMRGTV